jgi:hypothetical protein
MTSAASLLNAKRIILRGEYSSRDEGSKKGKEGKKKQKDVFLLFFALFAFFASPGAIRKPNPQRNSDELRLCGEDVNHRSF